jgi:hypothetical protein
MSEKSDSISRRAKNEALFKNRNEQVLRMSKTVLDSEARTLLPLNFLCECSDMDCREELVLTADQYVAMRKSPSQFIVKAGHESPDIEKVVRSLHSYDVVEKQVPVPRTSDIAPI